MKVKKTISIFDLRELKVEHADHPDLEVAEHCLRSSFDVWKIRSGKKIYNIVSLMGLFWACSCKYFKFRFSDCKHIRHVAPTLCGECRRVELEAAGLCEKCEEKNALYLKESSNEPAEQIGGIRV